jgi:hypothetical protein
MFDDSLLDDPVILETRGARLEQLARAGARLRYQRADDVAIVAAGLDGVRPRSVVVIGAEARLIRAVAESFCPVPLVTWQSSGLPNWAGPLDLIIVLAGSDSRLLPSCLEALRRGALLLVVAPAESAILDEFGPASALLTREDDPFVAALLVCKVLDQLGLGPALDLGELADALDQVAEVCGPRHSLADNPAKNLACALADTVPLLWGGSVLAARASRRVAEAVREATGLPVLAADDWALMPLIESARPHDLFADPFEDDNPPGYCVLVLDDGEYPLQGVDLAETARARGIRVETIRCVEGGPVLRYAAMLHRGLFAAAYLGLATIKE